MAIKRMFVTFPEAVQLLGGDQEAVRQAFFSHELTAFIEVHGAIATAETLPPDAGDGDAEDERFGTFVRDGQGFTKGSRWFRETGESPAENKMGNHFQLHGWYWVDPFDAEGWITRGSLIRSPGVWPSSDEPNAYYPPRESKDWFYLVDHSAFAEPQSYERFVWLSLAQIEELNSISNNGERTPSTDSKSEKLRSDREENLLRVAAGLWELSSLPSEASTVADKLSALFDGWGWEKPSKKTIADTVLARAAKLPRIRTS